MERYEGQLIRKFDSEQNGNAAAGVGVTVFHEDGTTPATVYTVNATTTERTQPFNTNVDGRFWFYAPNGTYWLKFNSGDDPIQIYLFDPADFNPFDEIYVVNSESEMLALQPDSAGAFAVRTDENNAIYMLSAFPASDISNWQLLNLSAGVVSWNGQSGVVNADYGSLPGQQDALFQNAVGARGTTTTSTTVNIGSVDANDEVVLGDTQVPAALHSSVPIVWDDGSSLRTIIAGASNIGDSQNGVSVYDSTVGANLRFRRMLGNGNINVDYDENGNVVITQAGQVGVRSLNGLGGDLNLTAGPGVIIDDSTTPGEIQFSVSPLAITDVFVVSSETEMLALDAQAGDVAKRTDLGQSFILQVEPASTLSNWVLLTDAGGDVQTVNMVAPDGMGNVQLDYGDFAGAEPINLNNAVGILGRDSSNNSHNIATVVASDRLFLGNSDLPTRLQSSAVPEASYGGTTYDLITTEGGQTVEGTGLGMAGVPYSWPSTQSPGALTNDGSGNLTWEEVDSAVEWQSNGTSVLSSGIANFSANFVVDDVGGVATVAHNSAEAMNFDTNVPVVFGTVDGERAEVFHDSFEFVVHYTPNNGTALDYYFSLSGGMVSTEFGFQYGREIGVEVVNGNELSFVSNFGGDFDGNMFNGRKVEVLFSDPIDGPAFNVGGAGSQAFLNSRGQFATNDDIMPASSYEVWGRSDKIVMNNDDSGLSSKYLTSVAESPLGGSSVYNDADGYYYLEAGNEIMRSSDGGYSWAVVNSYGGSPPSNCMASVIGGSGRIVFIGHETGVVRYSDDGTTWNTAQMTPSANVRWHGITYGGAYIAIGHDSANDLVVISRSTDAITWTDVTPAPLGVTVSSDDSLEVVSLPNSYIFKDAGGELWHSTDGLAWATVDATVSNHRSLAAGNGIFLTSLIFGGIQLRSSTDGVNWADVGSPVPFDYKHISHKIAFSNGVFYIFSHEGYNGAGGRTYLKTTDGTTTEVMYGWPAPSGGSSRVTNLSKGNATPIFNLRTSGSGLGSVLYKIDTYKEKFFGGEYKERPHIDSSDTDSNRIAALENALLSLNLVADDAP